MSYVSSVLWLVPLLVHVAYMLATYSHLPKVLRATATSATPIATFFIAWIAIIAAANGAFLLLQSRLPKFSNKALAVPGQSYWLSTRELKKELLDRFRGICEVALFCLNVFFLAVYQMIYQSNAAKSIVSLAYPTLILFFMVAPLVVVVASMMITVRGLAVTAKKNARK